MLQHTFKPEHTRTDKGSMKHDWAFIQREIGMGMNLVILGWPPGRALFNVKSRTLRVLTMMVCWWRLNVVTMATPLLFFIFLARCEDIHKFQDKIWIVKGTYFRALTYLPHTWSLQNFKCMEFKSPSVVVLHQGISRYCSWCSSHVRRCCLSIILLNLPLERLATKNTRRKTIS